MTNTKVAHTPGPWTVEERNRIAHHGAIEYVGPFVVICCLDGEAVAEIQDDGVPLEAESNARLIAAAPELLEVMRNALHILKRECYSTAADAGIVQAYEAAIAKAEGGAS